VTNEARDSRSYRVTRQVGVTAWTIIGLLILLLVLVSALAAVSEIALPLAFAVMLGAAAYPLARRLQRWLKPAAAAAVVLFGSLAGLGLVAVLTVRNVVHQTGELTAQIDRAIKNLGTNTDAIGLDAAKLESLRKAITTAAVLIGKGLLTLVVGGVGALTGFVAGIVLAVLIGYYVLKDGPVIKNWVVQQFPDAARPEVDDYLRTGVVSIRSYWAGRSVLSACVTVVIVVVSLLMGLPLIGTIAVVNFLGGYIPYLGAFIGGGLATLLALAEGGLKAGFFMIVVVLVCNLLLENLLEPKIMSERLSIHPLVVLLATTFGGVVGGMVGLILAMPVTVLVIDLVRRVRASGVTDALPGRMKSIKDTTLGS
jgi:predicted PurR-regulated permease PerM